MPQDRSTLKTYFETGDVPTQNQFGEFIDSVYNITEDGPVENLVKYRGNYLASTLYKVNDEVNLFGIFMRCHTPNTATITNIFAHFYQVSSIQVVNQRIDTIVTINDTDSWVQAIEWPGKFAGTILSVRLLLGQVYDGLKIELKNSDQNVCYDYDCSDSGVFALVEMESAAGQVNTDPDVMFLEFTNESGSDITIQPVSISFYFKL